MKLPSTQQIRYRMANDRKELKEPQAKSSISTACSAANQTAYLATNNAIILENMVDKLNKMDKKLDGLKTRQRAISLNM